MSRSFFISGSESYVNMTRIEGLSERSIRHVTVDQTYDYPFVYTTKVSSPTSVSFFDCNSNTFIADMAVSVSNLPTRMFFDVTTSTLIFDDTQGNIIFYSLISKTSEQVSGYDDVPISTSIDISSSDKEIAISDALNHRIIVIDRFTRLLRIISNISMKWPYRTLCLNDGTFLVRCFSDLDLPAIYRLAQNGDLLENFPSFTPLVFSGDDLVVEDWYQAYRSPATGISAFTFKDYEGVLLIDESNNYYQLTDLTGYSVSGVYVDDSLGDVFVNAVQSSVNTILKTRIGYGILETQKSPGQGLIYGLSDFGAGFEAFSKINNANNSNLQTVDANFSAIDGESIPEKLSSSNTSLSSQTSSFKKVDDVVVHVNNRFTEADIWHFRYTGIVGSKVSIDRSLTFDSFSVDNLIRSPVFCWDFYEDEYVDTFFISDGKYVRKMACFYDKDKIYVENVKEIEEENVVSSIFVFDGRFVVSAGGYLSVYSYENMNRLDSYYFANDVIASDCRFGYIWASSKSRGKIWRINQYDLSLFDEFDALDAPCGIFWSDYFGKYIVQCDNSLKYMDYLTGVITTFYDVDGYVIEKILIVNDEIAMLLKSHESVPVASDYVTNEEFQVAVRNRKEDKVCVLVPNKNKYSLEKSLPYNWNTSDVTFDGETVSYLSTDNLVIYIGFFLKSSGIETVYTYDSTEQPVGIVELPLVGKSVAVLSDWSVLDWSSGEVLEIDSWANDNGSTDTPGNASLISNGMIIKRTAVGRQTGSSSSSCSSSSQSGLVKTYYVRIMVGDSPGSSNKWDSGEFTTTERCVLYGGGNNLEPGQQYYVSLRCKGDLGVWSPYDTFGFVMPHFENYSYKTISSSSSSSNSVNFIDTVYSLSAGETLDCGSFDVVAIVFDGSVGESGQIILGSTTVTVRNFGGNLLFAPGESYEHEFTFVGETHVVVIGAITYSVTWILESDLVFVVHLGT